jgi:hypothetical protein
MPVGYGDHRIRSKLSGRRRNAGTPPVCTSKPPIILPGPQIILQVRTDLWPYYEVYGYAGEGNDAEHQYGGYLWSGNPQPNIIGQWGGPQNASLAGMVGLITGQDYDQTIELSIGWDDNTTSTASITFKVPPWPPG